MWEVVQNSASPQRPFFKQVITRQSFLLYLEDFLDFIVVGPYYKCLARDLSRSCKTYPEQTGVFLQDLERFLQESYKICKKCSAGFLLRSCMIFLVVGGGATPMLQNRKIYT